MKNLTKEIDHKFDILVWNDIYDLTEYYIYVYLRDTLQQKIWLQTQSQLQNNIHEQIKEELNEKLN